MENKPTEQQVMVMLRSVLRDLKGDTAADRPGLEALSLTEDLGLDSLDLINVLFRVEEQYRVKIPEEAIAAEGLLRIGALAAYVARRAGAPAAPAVTKRS